ncbi:hypothetical protein ACFEMC_05530 [Kineococcus sp. DHX-1]
MPLTASPPATRSGIARWKRGTAPKHGAFVAVHVILAIMMPALALLAWLNHFGWWLSIPAAIAGAGSIATAVHEVHLLRRGEGSPSS